MKIQTYTMFVFALAFLPISALAQTQVVVNGEARVQVRAGISADVSASATTSTGVVRDEEGEDSDDESAERTQEGLAFGLLAQIEGEDDDASPVLSLAELKARIEARRAELDDETASSTDDEDRDVRENTNPVRVAVHTFLASKALLGGIGPQVSEIAKAMNDSLATTTSVEVKLKSRGFLARFLFGGDKNAAERLQEQIDRNQDRIDALKTLLAQVNVSAELKATLEAQVTVLEAAQTRLTALADKEGDAWGLFSWRF